MRTEFALIILLNVLPAAAQTLGRSETWKLLEIAGRERARVIDGQLVDLKPLSDYFNERPGAPPSKPLPGWRPILGRIVQVTDDGLLVSTLESTILTDQARTVYLKNYWGQTVATDGKPVAVFAYRRGRTNYIDTVGARRTVELWDCGEPCSPDQLRRMLELEAKAREREKVQALSQQQERAKKSREEAERRDVVRLQNEATNGASHAQFALGIRYLNGRGVSTDTNIAMHWLKAACTNGNASASNELARILGTQ